MSARTDRSGSRCPSQDTRHSRSTASSGSRRPRRPPRAPPVLPQPFTVEARVEVVPGQHLVEYSRSRIVYQSRSTGSSASAGSAGTSSDRRRSARSSRRSAPVAPACPEDRPTRRSPRDRSPSIVPGRAVVVAEADRATVLLVAHRRHAVSAAADRWSRGRAVRPTGTACAAWAQSRRSTTVHRMSRRPDTSRPVAMTFFARSAISAARPRRSRSGAHT